MKAFIKVIDITGDDDGDKLVYNPIPLDEFLFTNFELQSKKGWSLPKNDMMFFLKDHEFYLKIDDGKWKKIEKQEFYF